MSRPVDIFAALRKSTRTSKSGKTTDRMTIEIKADELLFDPDERAISGLIAKQIAEVISSNLLAGKAPDGSPMPPVKAETQQWREREAELGRRGGEADPKFKDPSYRAKVKRNYQRDYTAPRLGQFTPQAGGGRGVVSGMLAKFAARANADGKSFSIFTAAKRGRPRPGETESALESTFRGIPLWSEQGMSQPEIREAMRAAATNMFGTSAGKLISELRRTAELTRDIAGELDDDGEGE